MLFFGILSRWILRATQKIKPLSNNYDDLTKSSKTQLRIAEFVNIKIFFVYQNIYIFERAEVHRWALVHRHLVLCDWIECLHHSYWFVLIVDKLKVCQNRISFQRIEEIKSNQIESKTFETPWSLKYFF